MNLLEIKDLKVHYPIKGGFFNTVKDHVKAVDGVSISIPEGHDLRPCGRVGFRKDHDWKSSHGIEPCH